MSEGLNPVEIRDSFVRLDWAGEVRTFQLRLGEVRALQEATGFGPQALYRRFSSGDWHIDDLRETLRQGLIGGGLRIDETDKLLRINFDGKPYLQHVIFAEAVLTAVLVGVRNDPPSADGEKVEPKPSKKKTKGTPPGESPSERSISTPPRSDSRPGKSTS